MAKLASIGVTEYERDVLRYLSERVGNPMRVTLRSIMDDVAVEHGFITEDQRQSVPYADLEPVAPSAKKATMPKPRPRAITEARTPALKKYEPGEKAKKVEQRKSIRFSAV